MLFPGNVECLLPLACYCLLTLEYTYSVASFVFRAVQASDVHRPCEPSFAGRESLVVRRGIDCTRQADLPWSPICRTSAASGRRWLAYRGPKIDLECFLQRMVFGGDVVAAVDRKQLCCALYWADGDTDERVAGSRQRAVGVTVSLLFRNGGTTQINSA